MICPEKILVRPESFCHFLEKNVICGEKFLVCPENFFEMTSPHPTPVALGALFNRKVPLEACPANKGEFRSRPISAFVYIFALSQSECVKRFIT
jgi:hypothetical protein